MASYVFYTESVNIDNLTEDIASSTISGSGYQYCNYNYPNLEVVFSGTLDSVEQTTLSGLVAGHDTDPEEVPAGYVMTITSEGKITFTDIADLTTVYYAESNTGSSTNSTTFQDKISLTFGSGISGTYRLGYTMSYEGSTANKEVFARFYNSTDDEVLDLVSQKAISTTSWYKLSGFIHITLDGTQKTFKLQFAAGTTACTAKYARIEAWRVS